MSTIKAKRRLLAAVGAGGASTPLAFAVANSILLDGSTGCLRRTPSVAGNRQKWMAWGWVKRNRLNDAVNASAYGDILLGCGTTAVYPSANVDAIGFSLPTNGANNLFGFVHLNSGDAGTASGVGRKTSAVFRDLTAWTFFHVCYDSANATAADRFKLFKNGVRVDDGDFGSSFFAAVPLNHLSNINSTVVHAIGLHHYISDYFLDASLAEWGFADGFASDPVGVTCQFDARGVCVPKEYTGSYGTNGWRLEFKDPSQLGKDTSGNGNHWTVAGGVTSRNDGPSVNAALFHAHSPTSSADLGVGNRSKTLLSGASGSSNMPLTLPLPVAGKVYWELGYSAANPVMGIAPIENLQGIATRSASGMSGAVGGAANEVGISTSGAAYKDGVALGTIGPAFTTSERMGLGWDASTRTLTQFKNGVATGVSWVMNAGFRYAAVVTDIAAPPSSVSTLYTIAANMIAGVPSGYAAFTAAELPAPQVPDPSTIFRVVTWTGTGGALAIPVQDSQGNSWTPDLVAIKRTDNTGSWAWYDSVRGATKAIASDGALVEATDASGLTAFTAGGFSVGASHSASGATYVAYCWKKQAGVFDIVAHTGNGANRTVSHALGVAPAFSLTKALSAATDWTAFHASLGAGQKILLSSTAASASDATAWNSLAPTASVLNLGTQATVNANGVTFISYVWADVPGMQTFGKYTGSGAADGPIILADHSPALTLFKRTDNVSQWTAKDSKSNAANPASRSLVANTTAALATSETIDFLACGVKIRDTDTDLNASSGVYLYASWALQPTGGAGNFPATAR